MNKLKISLEYHCYPVWILDPTGKIVENDLPDDIRCNNELDSMFVKIQEMFDSCYIDTPKEFSARGFNSPDKEVLFKKMICEAEEILRKEAEGKYIVENAVMK